MPEPVFVLHNWDQPAALPRAPYRQWVFTAS